MSLSIENVDPTQVGVLLNANAGGVSKRVRRRIERHLPGVQVYLSQSRDEAAHHVREILKRRLPLLLSGGGDGSAVQLLNDLRQSLHLQGLSWKDIPLIGLLKLGTGNGWANTTGASSLYNSLKQIRLRRPKTERFHLLEVENTLSHFAGCGWDADILHGYHEYSSEKDDFLHRGVMAYLTSMFMRTIPRVTSSPTARKVKIWLKEGPAYRVNHQEGVVPLKLKEGDLLYEGVSNFTGVATTECFGFGFRANPFARKLPGHFSLRVADLPVRKAILNIHQLWLGRYQGADIQDFLVRGVHIEFNEELPFQIGGDARGLRKQLDVQLADESVEMLRWA